jgi:hypothetical protein
MSEEKRHWPYYEVARIAALTGLGPAEDATRESSIEALKRSETSLGDAALLEIVRRINQVVEALAEDAEGDGEVEKRAACSAKPPKRAVRFDGASVGDVFYRYNPDDYYIARSVAFGVTPSGHVLLVRADQQLHGDGLVTPWWAEEADRRTPGEALTHSLSVEPPDNLNDALDFYERMVERLKRLKEGAAGGELSEELFRPDYG